jgi:hypothetical protein
MSVASHRTFLRRKGFQFATTDTFFVAGQSNAAQTTPVPNSIPFTTSAGVAWGQNYNSVGLLGPFQNGSSSTSGWGQSNGWVHFAETWKTLTGHSSVWLNLAVAGSPLVPASQPGGEYFWSVSDLSKSLAGTYTYTAGGETLTRTSMFGLPDQSFAKNPGLVSSKRYFIWVQGEADANSLALGRLTGDDYKNELNSLFTYVKANYDIDYFIIVELGRKGNDLPTIEANELSYAPIRTAQAAVATMRTDTHVLFTGCKSTDILLVDGSGYWLNGMDYQADGVHYTAESYRAIGKTLALNAFNSTLL